MFMCHCRETVVDVEMGSAMISQMSLMQSSKIVYYFFREGGLNLSGLLDLDMYRTIIQRWGKKVKRSIIEAVVWDTKYM